MQTFCEKSYFFYDLDQVCTNKKVRILPHPANLQITFTTQL